MTQNKYDIVKQGLKTAIENHEYEIGAKLPTESELMAQYQVSRYTIRRAVGDLQNDHYIYRIQGGGMYVDDWESHLTKTAGKHKLIGVITTHLADYIFPQIISGIDRAVSAHGYSIIVSNTHNDPDRERQGLERMLENQVAGLIIEPTQSALVGPNMDLYDRIKELNIPTIFINAHYPQLNFPYLEIKDMEAEEKMVNHLIELGHQRIMGIFQVDDMQGTHRMKGFINAYMQHPDISYLSKTIMYQSGQDMTKVLEQVAQELEHPTTRPTALVCYNDELAIQIIDLVRSMDLRVPKDISITGFDDYVLTRYMTPRLTTIQHPKEKMGLDAGQMIIKLIDGEPVQSINYDSELIFNNSITNN